MAAGKTSVHTLAFFQALQTLVMGMYSPSFISEWVDLIAHNATLANATVSHNLSEHPVKVDVQVKVTDDEKDYIFTGIGSAHRDDDVDADYGGVIYVYNDVHVRLYVPYVTNSQGTKKGMAAFTGGKSFTGPKTIGGKYQHCLVRVRAWKLSDMGIAAFDQSSLIIDDTVNTFFEVNHNLGVYPDIVSVQVHMADGYISDAQGNVFTTTTLPSVSMGGVVYGYNENKIRLWAPKRIGNQGDCGGVFAICDGWTDTQNAKTASLKIRMWILLLEKIFEQTTLMSVTFPFPYSLDDHLVTVTVTAQDENNTNYRFAGAGSCMGEGSSSLGTFGGVVYVYNAKEVLLYRPSLSSRGKLIYIGGRWGNGANAQSSNDGSIIVKVFKFEDRNCSIPPDVSNAIKHYDDVRQGSKVLYSRNKGYFISTGNNLLYCSAGSWEGELPICSEIKCSEPGEIGHASKSYTGTTTGHKVIYTCDTGYNLTHGNSERICEANGQWSGISPICTVVKCPNPERKAHTSRCFEGIEAGDRVSDWCYYGYRTSSGNTVRTCKNDGTWDGSPKVCIAKQCQDPGYGTGVDRQLKGKYHNDRVTYTCKIGYKYVSGDLTLTCIRGDYWKGVHPVCVVIPCPDPGDITNAAKALLGVNPGNTVTYACNSGYKHTLGTLKRTCQLGGSWDGTAPVCIAEKAVMCSDPGPVINAGKTLTGTSPGSSVIYNCNNGYSMSSGNLIRTCNPDGTWSGTKPICSPIQCPRALNIPNAVAAGSKFNPGDIVSYTCKRGFFHSSGDLSRTCSSSGSWNGSAPVCSRIECSDPWPVTNAVLSMMGNYTDDNVTYTCLTGYVRSFGDSTLTCDANGEWKGRYPTCSVVQCPDPGNIQNSVKTLLGKHYGDAVIYICEPLYSQTSGDLIRTCMADGTWNGTAPVCKEYFCPIPIPVAGAYMVQSGYAVGESIIYKCHEGYVLSSGFTKVTCLQTRIWDSDGPNCTLITCNDPDVGANGTVTITHRRYRGSANYTCDPGFAVTSGDSVRYCTATGTANGRWTGSVPICTEYMPVVSSLNNLDSETLRKMVAVIQSKLKFPVKNTTNYKRSLNSANDDRPTSKFVGIVGIVILTLIFGTIILIDFFNFLKFKRQ